MISAETLLQKYWGFDRFRPFQKEIISSVLEGKDTLGLLPTGGGKSICYQIPALMKEGIVLVVSPLIALMQDQVAQLKQKKIPAMMLERPSPGQSLTDQLDNLDYGPYKILFLSPERLQNSDVAQRLVRLPIHLLAVDEAHCVSEWGPDFRPAFLAIKDFRERLSNVPLLALTASATPAVLEDMKTKLALTNPVLHRASFNRPNLKYRIEKTNDKVGGLLKRLSLDEEPCIVYCRTRNKTETLYQQLKTQHTVAFFHGGLDEVEKKERLESWLQQDTRIMVATLAFGMGIDKSNVRQVIHMSPPESIEHYYQETGRAGRDGIDSTAILLVHPSDKTRLNDQFLSHLPDSSFIKRFFEKLTTTLNIAYGEGAGEEFKVNLKDFCDRYNFHPKKTLECLKILDREGVLELQQAYETQTYVKIVSSASVASQRAENVDDAARILQFLMRNYQEIFRKEKKINLGQIVDLVGISFEEILKKLEGLKKENIVDFQHYNTDLKLYWKVPREDQYTLNPFLKRIKAHHQQKSDKIGFMIDYAFDNSECKRNKILRYFGEKKSDLCKQCSARSCRKEETVDLDLPSEIKILLQRDPLNAYQIGIQIGVSNEFIVIALQEMIEENIIGLNELNQFYLK